MLSMKAGVPVSQGLQRLLIALRNAVWVKEGFKPRCDNFSQSNLPHYYYYFFNNLYFPHCSLGPHTFSLVQPRKTSPGARMLAWNGQCPSIGFYWGSEQVNAGTDS